MVQRMMTYHALSRATGWMLEPEECLLPWTGLAPIYAHLNGGRYVGLFGTSIV